MLIGDHLSSFPAEPEPELLCRNHAQFQKSACLCALWVESVMTSCSPQRGVPGGVMLVAYAGIYRAHEDLAWLSALLCAVACL